MKRPNIPWIEPPTEENVTRAVAWLRAGELIGLPTETVYGLAADAGNADAVSKIFAAKGRPVDHPLIVHVASSESAKAWAATWPDTAEKLAAAFWPGPMTLIVKRASHVLDVVTGGQDTVGLRVPSHPVAQAVMREFAGDKPATTAASGLAAPSANQFGQVSATTAAHVAAEFPDRLLLILDGGACDVGVESTIVDVSGDAVRILRPGRVRANEIERVLGVALANGSDDASDAPRVSGSLASHYAPRTPTIMLEERRLRTQLRAFRQAHDSGPTRCVITHSFDVEPSAKLRAIRLAADAQTWEFELYSLLRALDSERYGQLIIEAPPQDTEWDAVNDRVRRATQRDNVDDSVE
ncbi:MAG: L-threonylcarbamoyladenylate synthase [Casimicrobium sp.]|jgi:L-threonylcarbamoyladenylate synthase